MAGINLDELENVGIVDSNGNELTPNANGSIDVEATDLDIRNLDYTTDNVEIKDAGGDALAIEADGSINANVSFAPTTTMKTSAETVTTTAAEVLTTPLASRRFVTIQNEGNQDVYIGSTVGVTTATGIKVSKRSSATYELGAGVDIFMVAASGSQSVRFLEAA